MLREAEVIGNSSDKIHQTWGPDRFLAELCRAIHARHVVVVVVLLLLGLAAHLSAALGSEQKRGTGRDRMVPDNGFIIVP